MEILHNSARERKVYVAELILQESTDATDAEKEKAEAILMKVLESTRRAK